MNRVVIHRHLLVAFALFGLAMALVLSVQVTAQEAGSDTPDEQAVAANLGTAFTYQGRLQQSDLPATGNFDFQFSLFDAPTSGTQVGSTQTKTSVAVADGLFDVVLNFGDAAFDGQARWLEIAVRPTGGGSYTALTPRVPLNPAPYALALPGLHTTQSGGAGQANIIGGYYGNQIGAPSIGVTISGGGNSALPNSVYDSYGTVSGGLDNVVGIDDGNAGTQYYATVGGGRSNKALANFATVAGGGPRDIANPNTTNNRVYDNYGTIGGGGGNVAGSDDGNQVGQSYATVGGGATNTASGVNSTVSGGNFNRASATNAVVGGGASNQATGTSNSTVGGGYFNSATNTYATIGGGYSNAASGAGATIPGGYDNSALGDYSFAAGYRASANGRGSFVWNDNSGPSLGTTAINRFLARAAGGFYLYSSTANTGVYLSSGSGTWRSLSDQNTKTAFEAVDTSKVLESVASLPISTWQYKTQDSDIRHIGPMAQDFATAFGLGGDEKSISVVDADGVSLAAIQGLYQLAQEQQAQIETLTDQNAAFEARLAALEAHTGTGVEKAQAGVQNIPTWLLALGVVGMGVVLVTEWRRVRGRAS